MEHTYKIHVSKGNYQFTIESTDKEWIDTQFELLNVKTTSQSNTQPDENQQEHSLPPGLTLQEFYRKYIKDKDITTNPKIATFFVYYLEKIEKKSDIKTGEIQECFGKVGIAGYNKINYSDILAQAKRQALLNHVNSRWSLTTTGEDYVLNTITEKE